MLLLMQIVSRAVRSLRRVGVALFAVLTMSSCVDLPRSQCSTDSECPASKACVVGWFGGTCYPRCSSNADCAADSFCTTQAFCQEGCRDSSGCAETELCNLGYCVVDCYDAPHVCDQGRPGSVCVGASLPVNGVPNGSQVGLCRPSCQTDSDCANANFKQCLCGSCTEPCNPTSCGSDVCRATQDCATPRCLPR
jgi:hypothetical protein